MDSLKTLLSAEFKTFALSVASPAIVSVLFTLLTFRYKIRKEVKYNKLYSNLEEHKNLFKEIDYFLTNEALTMDGFDTNWWQRKILKDEILGKRKRQEDPEGWQPVKLYDYFYKIYQERFDKLIENIMRLSTPDIQKISKKIFTKYGRTKWNIERLQDNYPDPNEIELQQYKKEEEKEMGIFCVEIAPLLEKLVLKLEKIIEFKK